jgi:hypothetical protein
VNRADCRSRNFPDISLQALAMLLLTEQYAAKNQCLQEK